MKQYMVASLIPEESALGRVTSTVRSMLEKKGIPFLYPKPKDHISYLPPFFATEEFADGFAKGLRFCVAFDTKKSGDALWVAGCDYFGENGRALAIELECATSLRNVVEDLRASINRERWVHDPDNYLFRPHATIAYHDDLRKNMSGVPDDIRQLIPRILIDLPPIRLLERVNKTGKWAVRHF